jgi:hypothetical protein
MKSSVCDSWIGQAHATHLRPRCLTSTDSISDPVSHAYVNVGSLDAHVRGLRSRYPKAKFILTSTKGINADSTSRGVENDLNGADVAVLNAEEPNRWQVVCEHLRCPPPACSFPEMNDIGKRPTLAAAVDSAQGTRHKRPRRDKSPWVVEPREWWRGIPSVPSEDGQTDTGDDLSKRYGASLEIDPKRFSLRTRARIFIRTNAHSGATEES